MQRYGPPPSYPNLKIPGLNSPIPEVLIIFNSYESLSLWWANCRAVPLGTLLVDGASHLLMSGDVPSMEMCLAWRVEKVALRDPEMMRKWTRLSGESLSRKKRSRLKM